MKCVNKELTEKLAKHLGIIHKISLLYTNNKADREDLFQDICFQVCRSYNSYRKEAKFSTWLYRVAINTAITQVRKSRSKIFPNGTLEELSEATGNTPENEHSQLLFQAISQLNKIDRAIIMLWLEEHNYDEIADILGISNSNAGVRINRAKSKLEKILQPYFT